MSSSKRSKEDTWTEAELLKSLKPEDKAERRRERGKDDKTRSKGEHGESSKSQKETSDRRSRHRDSDPKASSKEKRPREKEKQKSSGDAHKTSKSKTSDAGDGDVAYQQASVFDRDVLEHRSIEKKEKRRSERPTKESSPGRKKDKEQTSGEKKKKRSDKERKEKEHRRRGSGVGEVKYQLNETFDVDALDKELKRSLDKDKKKESDDKGKQRKETRKHKEAEEDLEKRLKKDQEETLISPTSDKTRKTETKEEDENDYNYDDDEFDDYDDDDFEDDEDMGDASDEVDNVKDDGAGSDEDREPMTHVPSELGHNTNEDSKLMTFKTGKGKGSVNISRESSAQERMPPAEETLNINDVAKAIFAENERASSNSSSRNNSRPSTGTEKAEKSEKPSASIMPVKKPMGKINFVAASQKQMNEKAARKTRRRGEELLQLIQLDVRKIELFDMAPMSEYELYMKRFGQSGCTQAYAQCGEDDVSQNTQTDEIETVSKWCQCSHETKSCGTDENSSFYSNTTSFTIDTSRLNKFLLKSGLMVMSLLNELQAGIEQHQKQYTELKSTFSDGYVSLDGMAQLSSTFSFSDLSYSPSHTNMLLTAYGENRAGDVTSGESFKGVITVWNTNVPTGPSAYLICESIPSCCCFSLSNPVLVFAGMNDGVLCVWDLREPAGCHEKRNEGAENEMVLRTATFTTAVLKENHQCPVIAISPLRSNTWKGHTNNGEIDMSFQLMSLDQSGKLNIWIVVEVHVDASDLSNINDDMGLSPTGCIKLAKSSSMNVFTSTPYIDSSFDTLFCATCVQVAINQPNHLYIGTDKGNIAHALRFGCRPTPKLFKTDSGIGNKVNAIDVSPWKLPYFLACAEDGSVSLFHGEREKVVCKWNSTNEEPVINVKWSKSKACIFFALDATSTFYIWDMFQTDMEPIFKQQIKRKNKLAVDFTLANDYTFAGDGTPGRAAEMALMFDDGSIEIHRLSKAISNMDGDELDRLEEYLGDML